MRSTETRRRGWLWGALVVCAGVWLASVLTSPDRVEPRLLTREDLREVPVVRSVTARPPSLFVELDAQAWSAMSDPERLRALEAIGRIAADAGYSGIHARTSDGAVAGGWLARGGASLARSSPRGT